MISWQRRSGTVITLDGGALRALRESRGLTQREVADKIGCTAAAVSSWECETCCPSLPQIERIKNVFGVRALVMSGAIEVTP